jgi:hypothetical protein
VEVPVTPRIGTLTATSLVLVLPEHASNGSDWPPASAAQMQRQSATLSRCEPELWQASKRCLPRKPVDMTGYFMSHTHPKTGISPILPIRSTTAWRFVPESASRTLPKHFQPHRHLQGAHSFELSRFPPIQPI